MHSRWLFACVTITCVCTLVLAQEWKNSDLYTADTVFEQDVYTLRYGADDSTAYFAISFTHPDIVPSGSSMVGFGIADPTAGSMTGADIVTAEVSADGESVKCELVDRYVPFVAYPLSEPQGPFPIEDTCGESDWQLVSCERDGDGTTLWIEMSRELAARDDQDRDIVKGMNRVIWAYGSQVSYHGSNRGSSSIDLGSSQRAFPPADADDTVELLFDKYAVPSVVTTYACQSFDVKDANNASRHIVAIEPAVQEENMQYVHHFVLHVCRAGSYTTAHETARPCIGFSPTGNPESGCYSVYYAWARGIDALSLPEEAGYLLHNAESTFILEIHYDNPEGESGIVDSSGVRMHTTSQLRPNDAATVVLGDGFVSRSQLADPSIKTDVVYRHECPSSCTSQLGQELNMFASFLHMHYYGKQIWTNVYDEGGEFVQTLNQVDHWDGGYQRFPVFSEPFKLQPGQQLETSCVYDVSKADKAVVPGPESHNEMCMDFVAYYPRQMLASGEFWSYCCPVFLEDGSEVGVCGLSPAAKDTESDRFNQTVEVSFGQGKVCAASSEDGASEPVQDQEADEGIEPTPEPSAGSGDVCFPASATVQTHDGAVVRMDRLKVGDRVRTGAATYSDVHMFGHAKDGWFSFLNISTHCGACLVVSANHIIEVNGGELKSAGSVKVGDRTERGMVVSVSRVRAQGLYHPHTVDGMIVVDGFRATTYTSVMPMSVARVLLYPVQLVYRMCGVNVVGSFFHEDRAYLLKGPRLAKHVVKNLLQRLVRSNLSG